MVRIIFLSKILSYTWWTKHTRRKTLFYILQIVHIWRLYLFTRISKRHRNTRSLWGIKMRFKGKFDDCKGNTLLLCLFFDLAFSMAVECRFLLVDTMLFVKLPMEVIVYQHRCVLQTHQYHPKGKYKVTQCPHNNNGAKLLKKYRVQNDIHHVPYLWEMVFVLPLIF